jgi:ATP-dependent Clp protease adaptor protein ClpS
LEPFIFRSARRFRISRDGRESFVFFCALVRAPGADYFISMPEPMMPVVLPEHETETVPSDALEPGFLVICWNDPVNLMDFVTHVFQKVFGWPKQKAEKHMREVHEQGKSLLTRESFEKAEHYVHQLQGYGLHATMERDQ